MKNLFKSLVAGMLLLVGASASAGMLYWQVSGADQDFDEAWLVAESKSDSTKFNIEGADAQPDKRSTALMQSDISAYESDAYLFYVEMINYSTNPETVTAGAKWSYDQLTTSGYVADSFDVPSVIAAASATNFGSPIPEPSSGLLLLMGGAMLALRRRRQK